MLLQLGLMAGNPDADANADANADALDERCRAHVMSIDDAATPESVARHTLEHVMAARWLIRAARCHPLAARAARRGEDCAVRFTYSPNTTNAADSTVVHIASGADSNSNCSARTNRKDQLRKQLRGQKSIPHLLVELCLRDTCSAREEDVDVDAGVFPVADGSPLGVFKDLGSPIVQGSLRTIVSSKGSSIDEYSESKILRVYEKEGCPGIASHCEEIGMGKVESGADILAFEAGENGEGEDESDGKNDDDGDDDLGPLVQTDARFVPHARQANDRRARRTPNLPDRIGSPPTRREMDAVIRKASIDPFQSRIITTKISNGSTSTGHRDKRRKKERST